MARYRSPLLRSKRRSDSKAGSVSALGTLILLIAILALWWFVLRPINEANEGWTPPPLTFGLCGAKGAGRACVIDGDTLHIRRGKDIRRIRITGFNAPELDGACEAERRQALAAKRALHAWMAQGTVEWDGGTEPPFDQYGRELRSLRRPDGKGGYEELADYMLTTGMAAPSGWGTSPKDWCA